MKAKRVLINFPPTYLQDMDRIAGEMQLSRSELVLLAVSHWTVCDDGEAALRRKMAERLVVSLDGEDNK
jgi:hypothetical protein